MEDYLKVNYELIQQKGYAKQQTFPHILMLVLQM